TPHGRRAPHPGCGAAGPAAGVTRTPPSPRGGEIQQQEGGVMPRRAAPASLCLGLLVLATRPGAIAGPVALPPVLTGGGTGGSTWKVVNTGGTTGGPMGVTDFTPGVAIEDATLSTQSDSFDNGLTVWVNDTIVKATDTDGADRTGRTINVPAQTI